MLHVGSAPVDPEKVHLAILEEFPNNLILCRSLRWILFPSALLVGVLQERACLGTEYLQASVCLVASVLDGYGHPENTWKL